MTNNPNKYPLVILTKPQGQNRTLQDLLEAENYESLELPCLQLANINAKNFWQAMALVNRASEYDYWLFTSKNAVQYAHFMQLNWQANVPCFAIGSSTQGAISAYSNAEIIAGDPPFTSEKLLEKLSNYSLQKVKVLIFTGMGGRNILPAALKAFGAKVDIAQLYQRKSPPSRFSRVLHNMDKYVICISSEEALRNLVIDYKLISPNPEHLQTQTLIVSSQRLKNIARELNFKSIQVADSANNFDLAQAVKIYLSRF